MHSIHKNTIYQEEIRYLQLKKQKYLDKIINIDKNIHQLQKLQDQNNRSNSHEHQLQKQFKISYDQNAKQKAAQFAQKMNKEKSQLKLNKQKQFEQIQQQFQQRNDSLKLNKQFNQMLIENMKQKKQQKMSEFSLRKQMRQNIAQNIVSVNDQNVVNKSQEQSFRLQTQRQFQQKPYELTASTEMNQERIKIDNILNNNSNQQSIKLIQPFSQRLLQNKLNDHPLSNLNKPETFKNNSVIEYRRKLEMHNQSCNKND